MQTRTLVGAGVIASMLFGLGYLVVDDAYTGVYSIVGGLICAVIWVTVGVMSRK